MNKSIETEIKSSWGVLLVTQKEQCLDVQQAFGSSKGFHLLVLALTVTLLQELSSWLKFHIKTFLTACMAEEVSWCEICHFNKQCCSKYSTNLHILKNSFETQTPIGAGSGTTKVGFFFLRQNFFHVSKTKRVWAVGNYASIKSSKHRTELIATLNLNFLDS